MDTDLAVKIMKEQTRKKFRLPSVEELKREAGTEAARLGVRTEVITQFYASLIVEVLTEKVEEFEPFTMRESKEI